MNVLVTGATGYIGSAIVDALLLTGHEVTGLVRSDASAQKLESLRVRSLYGDLMQPKSLVQAAQQVDAVIHAAATGDEQMASTEQLLANALLILSILSAGVVYGVDVFFAVVGRPALAVSHDAAIANVMGHLHKTADARMPVFGILGVLATLSFAIVTQVGTTASWLALIALGGLLIQLSLYLTVAKPVNQKMTEALQLGKVPDDIRDLQNRWDSVIVGRALAMTLAIGCLSAAGVLI